MSVSEEEVLRAGKTTEAIRIPERFGGGFLASVEVQHHLHCVVSSLYFFFFCFTDRPCTPSILFFNHSNEVHQLNLTPTQNFLRKSLFSPAYYHPPSPHASLEFTDPPSTIATHQAHCVEMLRQFVMCHADVGIITHRWVEGHPRPYPDFNTWHKCRDFEGVLAWTKERAMKEGEGGVPEGWRWEVGEEDVVLERPP
ncbi:MAG: hypothetical protein LQ350_006513 [Teloschistes chrysophthalmus]|nr:MAG: hypothetical protein LQ350_006513 [Niorma chrysophthalma]